MVSQWYETYFQGMAVELWAAFGTEELTNSEAAFLTGELLLTTPAAVLDLACGSGRHASALAKIGHRVTGIDLSSAFLDIARHDPAVEWIQGDMRNPPRRGFDAAYSWGNSFGYLEHSDTVTFLHNVAASLREGGRFVLDTGTVAEAFLPAFQSSAEYDVAGIRMQIERSYDSRRSRFFGRYTFERDGVCEVREMDQAVYTCGEIVRLFEQAGFAVEQLYGGLDRAPFTLGSRRLLVTASRVRSS